MKPNVTKYTSEEPNRVSQAFLPPSEESGEETLSGEW